jgi:tetratricopeptide (TPR) repeat protein
MAGSKFFGRLWSQAGPNSADGSRVSSNSRIWIDAGLVVCLAIIAFLPYRNARRNLFVYDDLTQVVNNPYLQNYDHLKEILTTPVWSFIGRKYDHNYYRPMMSLGYLFCYQFFGPRPIAFHTVNIVLNVLVVILLFFVTRRMFNNRMVAFIAAGLFAVHPIHSESVDWIAAVTDVELAVFYLLAFWFFLALSEVRGRRLILTELGMTASFALALLSKEPAATLAVLATLFEHFCRKDRDVTSAGLKLSRYGPLWLLLVVYLILRTHVVGGLASRLQYADTGTGAVIFSAIALCGQYLWKMFWPAKLCAFHVFEVCTSPLEPRVLLGAVALTVFAALFVLCSKRARLIAFALAFIFLNLVPVLNIHWMAVNVFTERYLYLPSAGFCWILGWAWTAGWKGAGKHRTLQRGILVLSAVAIAVLCTFQIIRRNRDWHDNETFYKATLALEPGAYLMHNNLGLIYLDRNDFVKAEEELKEAERQAPEYPMILDNVGALNLKLRRYDDALGYFIRSVMKEPNEPQPHIHLAQLYEQTGQPGYAEKEYLTAISLAPLSHGAHSGFGDFYFDQGRLAEAEQQYQESLRAAKTLRGYWGLGLVYWREGRYAEAERAFKAAGVLAPDSARVHILLGLLYAAANRNQEAILELETGLKSDPANPQALDALRKLQGH